MIFNKIKKLFKKKVGYKEYLYVTFENGYRYCFTAKLDTGNSGMFPTIDVDVLEELDHKVRFRVNRMPLNSDISELNLSYPIHVECVKGEIYPVVGKDVDPRKVISVREIEICGRKIENTYVALADRSHKDTQALICRNTMSELGLVIDPSKCNIS